MGVKQAIFTGNSWRHGLVVLMFMVAGMVSRREPGSTEPLDVGKKRKRPASPQGRDKRQRADLSAARAAQTHSDSDGSVGDTNFLSDGSDSDTDYSDAGTDGTMAGGEEAEEAAPVPELTTTSAEYRAVFGTKRTHDAVLEVVCRAAAVMAKLCGDNKTESYTMTEPEAMALSEEAYEFVTTYVRALFGAINTTKFHTLAYHLLEELLLRGNVVEADTSVSEALHKLIKNMWDNTNKQTTSVLLQMLRAEQTLAHVTESDAHGVRETGAQGNLDVDTHGSVRGAGVNEGGQLGGAATTADASACVREAIDADRDGPTCRSGSPELDVLSVFDELAAMSTFDGTPDAGEAAAASDEQVEVDDDVDDGGAHCGAGIASESHDATLRSVAPTAPGHSTLMRESGSHGLGDLSTADVWMAVNASDVGTRAAENSARARPARRRVRIAGRRTTVGQAAAADGGRLRQLPKL